MQVPALVLRELEAGLDGELCSCQSLQVGAQLEDWELGELGCLCGRAGPGYHVVCGLVYFGIALEFSASSSCFDISCQEGVLRMGRLWCLQKHTILNDRIA